MFDPWGAAPRSLPTLRRIGRLPPALPTEIEGGLLTECHRCDFDLREAPPTAVTFYEESARQAMDIAVRRLEGRGDWFKPRSVRYYNVLHQLCWLLGVRYRNVALREFACREIGIADVPVQTGRVFFEMRPVVERHHLLQLAFWYLADFDARLTVAWKAGAVTYSALLRDFNDRPCWYDRVARRFADRWKVGWIARRKRSRSEISGGGVIS
ncbi:hypothetical protein [Georgfuchsia toluolica]|uniref:hypothetical protein n=1 Tax=Georgfuchsia toluolica TaxID=424218 RepID=UPI001FE4A4DC|nr:hypothetical protein [Georgfuchsia toluolica]